MFHDSKKKKRRDKNMSSLATKEVFTEIAVLDRDWGGGGLI